MSRNVVSRAMGIVLVSSLTLALHAEDELPSERHLEVTTLAITLHDALGAHSVSIADVERIEVRTNDRGPLEDDMFWVFRTAKTTLEFPSDLPGEEELWPVFRTFPGFDHGKVVKAASSVKNATFVCWTKPGAPPKPR